MKNLITRWLEDAMGRLFQGPQPESPKYHTEGEISPEHADIEKLIADTTARWHGNQHDRRPLAKVLHEALRPYLKESAGHLQAPSFRKPEIPASARPGEDF